MAAGNAAFPKRVSHSCLGDCSPTWQPFGRSSCKHFLDATRGCQGKMSKPIPILGLFSNNSLTEALGGYSCSMGRSMGKKTTRFMHEGGMTTLLHCPPDCICVRHSGRLCFQRCLPSSMLFKNTPMPLLRIIDVVYRMISPILPCVLATSPSRSGVYFLYFRFSAEYINFDDFYFFPL